jgi:hypothetical protein
VALELIEDALGDPRNACTLALASDLAYMGQAEGAEAFRTQLGLDAKLFSVGNTQAFLLTNDEHIIVAYRGTESPTTIEGLKDWLLTDAANLLIVPEGRLGTDLAAAGVGARFHQGFVKAIGDIWDPLFEAVQAERQRRDRPLWLTGHSLGGALALLAGWLFRRKFVPVHQIYTFGGPMIGNKTAVEAIDRELAGRIFRYVNRPDPVPLLPTVSLIGNHYEHCQTETMLGAVVESVNFLQRLADKGAGELLTGNIISEIWTNVLERVDAHSMVHYRELVGRLTKPS